MTKFLLVVPFLGCTARQCQKWKIQGCVNTWTQEQCGLYTVLSDNSWHNCIWANNECVLSWNTCEMDLPASAPEEKQLRMNITPQEMSTDAGTITMWSDRPSLIGAECEYANAPATGLTDPMLASYIRDGMACAIGDSNPAFGKGETCGQCFHISTSGGSATIMAVDHVDGNSHFDCIRDAWDKITGQAPGKLPMQFTQVPCDAVSGNPVIVNWADKNAYYCKMMFENVGGWGNVDGVHMCIDGSNCQDLTLFQGATWTGCPTGEGNSATFTLSQRGNQLTCNCPGSWPWDHGARCTCASNFPTSGPGCTGNDQDPYASGSHVPCCSGLSEVLKNWDGDDRYYYKCEGGSTVV